MTSTARLRCKICGNAWDGDALLEFERHEAACKDKNNKSPKGYVAILGLLHDVAQRCGYSLGVHGTLGRDLDLMAMPWVENAESSEHLVEELAKACGGRVYKMLDLGGGNTASNPILRPHGREGWVVHLGGGTYLDVSVMPRRMTNE